MTTFVLLLLIVSSTSYYLKESDCQVVCTNCTNSTGNDKYICVAGSCKEGYYNDNATDCPSIITQ